MHLPRVQTARGANVEKIGLISTDVLTSRVALKTLPVLPSPLATTPQKYNGMKMAKAGAFLCSESGLFDIRDQAQKYLDAGEIPSVRRSAPLLRRTSSSLTQSTCASWWICPPSAR